MAIDGRFLLSMSLLELRHYLKLTVVVNPANRVRSVYSQERFTQMFKADYIKTQISH